jgi:DNA polymerase-1
MKGLLDNREWASNPTKTEEHEEGDYSLFDFYEMYIVPFAECLTDMERNGIMVDCDHLVKYVYRVENSAIAQCRH